MRNRREHLNDPDLTVLSGSRLFNKIALFLCWGILSFTIFYLIATNDFKLSILGFMFVPFRYFFFDITTDRKQRRPASLDRSIPLIILIHYLDKTFPVPQGGFLASCTGWFLAICRAVVNGYGLLFLDTFWYLFKVRNDEQGVPLSEDIGVIHYKSKIDQLEKEAQESNVEDRRERLQKLHDDWEKMAIANELDTWNFPILRYIDPQDPYFLNREIGAKLLDDKYQLDRDKFLSTHPGQESYFYSSKQLEEMAKAKKEVQDKLVAEEMKKIKDKKYSQYKG